MDLHYYVLILSYELATSAAATKPNPTKTYQAPTHSPVSVRSKQTPSFNPVPMGWISTS